MATKASSHTTEALSIPLLKNQSANLVSVLGHALTYAPTISAALVHRAHYTSNSLFDTNNNVKSIFYEAIDSRGKTKKIQLTKEKFSEALHLPLYNSKEMVIPTAEQLVDIFNAMGYEPQLETISTFKKKQLPDLWRYFFSIFLRCLSGRTSGLDSASQSFQSLLYGIYYDVKFLHWMKSLLIFCAQIPQEMLVKVSMDCDEVNTYRNTLRIPYLVREIIPAAPAKAPAQTKGKRKLTGGPSGPKRVTKKRKPSQQTTPKRKQSKKAKKVAAVDESLDSERTPSANIQAEEEEEHQSPPIHETKPPTPPSTTIPPPPPPTTAPPTATIISEQTTTIQTTTSDVPPTIAPQTSTIYTTETPPTSTTQITEPITSLIENPII
ncbi:hypothetical protein L1887_32274 [Cichorium endivia]|nr:hypothetical protein L1887_32274 [Cichorium endivia]